MGRVIWKENSTPNVHQSTQLTLGAYWQLASEFLGTGAAANHDFRPAGMLCRKIGGQSRMLARASGSISYRIVNQAAAVIVMTVC